MGGVILHASHGRGGSKVMDRRIVAWPGAGACRTPPGLLGDRLFLWSILRTVRDARLAERRGLPMPVHQLTKRFERRWNRAQVRAGDGMAETVSLTEAGKQALGWWAAEHTKGCRAWRSIDSQILREDDSDG